MALEMGAPTAWVLSIGLLCAALNWIAIVRSNRVLELVFKPATLTVFIVVAFILAPASGDPHLALWFRVALVFSLAGDVLLMLPGERWFVPGLVAFLFGHLCYIVGFNRVLPPWGVILPVAVAALTDLIVLRRIVNGLQHHGEMALRIPVIVYGVILSLTLVSGWATWFRPSWTLVGRLSAGIGGTLFYVSDLMLAWDRFVRESRWLHVLVMITYHLGQLGLMLTIGFAP